MIWVKSLFAIIVIIIVVVVVNLLSFFCVTIRYTNSVVMYDQMSVDSKNGPRCKELTAKCKGQASC